MRTLILGAVAALATGCGLSCTLMYAPSSTAVDIEGGDWTAGIYEIEIQGYNQFAMCVVTLPSDGSEPACTGNASVDLDASGEQILGFTALEFAPDSFLLELKRDGELLATEDYTPDYDVDTPNGEGCGQRRTAVVDLLL
ncbi:MAG: hypothetical protein KTR31_11325 [Myxococcales bacterium]|nr:hypothetical protein [Myxococcales bacterium]